MPILGVPVISAPEQPNATHLPRRIRGEALRYIKTERTTRRGRDVGGERMREVRRGSELRKGEEDRCGTDPWIVDHGLVNIVHFPYPFPHITLSKAIFEPRYLVVDIEILMRRQVTILFHRSLSQYIHTYIHTNVHISVHTYIHTYVRTSADRDGFNELLPPGVGADQRC